MYKTGNQKSDVFKLYYIHGAKRVGQYGLPQLMPTQFVPQCAVAFHSHQYVSRPDECWVDFFEDDYQFERFWSRPECYFGTMKRFAGVITPDFSMLPEMPLGQRIWNNTRNRVMAYYLQMNGFNIIPTASWCTPDDFGWCFDGLPENASIAVSTNGCKRSPYSRRIFFQGVEELYRQKHPSHIVVCGREEEELKRYTNVVYYPNFSQRRKERGR